MKTQDAVMLAGFVEGTTEGIVRRAIMIKNNSDNQIDAQNLIKATESYQKAANRLMKALEEM